MAYKPFYMRDGVLRPLKSPLFAPVEQETAPTANNDTFTTTIGVSVNINVLANDVAGSSPIDTSSGVITSQPNNGSAGFNQNGTVTYTPFNGFVGSNQFSYNIKGTNGLTSNTALVSGTVTENGTPPPVDADAGTTSYPNPQNVVTVNDANGLQNALNGASAGTHIVVNNASLSGNFTINKTATPNNPIVIRAANPLQARIIANSSLQVRGSNIWTWGLQFDGKRNAGASIDITGTDHKIIGCRFFDIGSDTVFTKNNIIDGEGGRSDRLEIGYCHFDTPRGFRSWTSADGQWPQWRYGMRFHRWADRAPYDLWVHHCRFNNFPIKPTTDYRSAQADAIEIAAIGSDFDTRNRINHCLFENIPDNSGSIIDIKAGRKCIVEYITTVNCTGRIDFRTVDQCIVRHIYMDSTQGIDIFGSDNLVEDVRFVNGGSRVIHVCIGNLPAGSSQATDQRVQARRAVIRGCPEANLFVGIRYTGGTNTLHPIDTTLTGPRASTQISATSTANGVTNNPSASVAASKAFRLLPADVGPTKLATFA